MAGMQRSLLLEVQNFLSETGMGASYFGVVSCGNCKLVTRLERGGRVWPETEATIRNFIKSERKRRKQLAAA